MVHRDRSACDWKFQSLSTTLINQSVKPNQLCLLQNSKIYLFYCSPQNTKIFLNNKRKLCPVIWFDQWVSCNSMGQHKPPNLSLLFIFFVSVSIQPVKQHGYMCFDWCAHVCPCDGLLVFMRSPPVGCNVCLSLTTTVASTRNKNEPRLSPADSVKVLERVFYTAHVTVKASSS
jgi:hypothetical protein